MYKVATHPKQAPEQMPESLECGLGLVRFDPGKGIKGRSGDCVARAICIATGLPYHEAYAIIDEAAELERPRAAKRRIGRSCPKKGVYKPTTKRIMARWLEWPWTPTMHIGSGCTVHLKANEVPMTGTHILSVSRHLVAIIDGVLYDTHDPSRGGTRCVYGYWSKP